MSIKNSNSKKLNPQLTAGAILLAALSQSGRAEEPLPSNENGARLAEQIVDGIQDGSLQFIREEENSKSVQIEIEDELLGELEKLGIVKSELYIESSECNCGQLCRTSTKLSD
jgi:hypothetical protein